ncbi:MAG: hypothetical protein V4591_04775 [Bdellovibrionota bacterium]
MLRQNHTHLNLLEHNASIFWREINPKVSSCIQLKQLLSMYATFENWESVINLSSRAVLHVNKNYERAEFYYIWICALNETHDYPALIHLAKHLIRMGAQCSAFYCLAAMAYTFAEKNKLALKLLKEQKKLHNMNNRYYREALGLFLTSLKRKIYVRKGMILLKKVCSNKSAGYFSWRNCIRVLSQNNCEDSMSRMLNLMHLKFPFAHEPYITSALIAMNENNWKESIRLLNQIIRDNPENKEAVLALSQCYEEDNGFENAYELMLKNKNLFHDQDYDYNHTMARLLEHNAREKNCKESCEDAVLFYDKVISLANFFHFPFNMFVAAREELQQFNKGLETKNKLLWSLEFFLQQQKPLSIASILSFEGAGRSLKFSSK